VRLDLEYEIATTDKRDLFIEQHLFMGSCSRCGRCYVPPTPLDRLMVVGFRKDEEVNSLPCRSRITNHASRKEC
jgi:uncharacterized OB-fold protein